MTDPLPKGIIYNDDGWSSYMRYPAPMSPEDVERVTVGQVAGTGVTAYQFCPLGGHAVNYRSAFLPRVGDTLERIDTMHVWRMRETLRHLDELGTDPLEIVTKACHKHGIACQFSLRMNDAHHVYLLPDGSPYFPELMSPWFEEHRDALLPGGQLDYEHPDVHEYRLQQIAEVLQCYDVAGIDLDFTRFRPFFREGREVAGSPRMTELVERIRGEVGERTLSARFEYDLDTCLRSGLAVDHWLAQGWLDQITLGGIGDHTPDAPSALWVELAHAGGCKVYPGMEGQLHWIVSCGGGGTGTHPGNGVHDGFGPPSIEYMRGVAALHYLKGADGVSLFNFTCADGPFSRTALTELADLDTIRFADKQYVVAMWPWDAQIYGQPWESKLRLAPGVDTAEMAFLIADGIAAAHALGRPPSAVLTLGLKGLNHIDDIEVEVNGAAFEWTGYHYNHFDHGCWNDIVRYTIPANILLRGENDFVLRRLRECPGFDGSLEVRKWILDVTYPDQITPGRIGDPG